MNNDTLWMGPEIRHVRRHTTCLYLFHLTWRCLPRQHQPMRQMVLHQGRISDFATSGNALGLFLTILSFSSTSSRTKSSSQSTASPKPQRLYEDGALFDRIIQGCQSLPEYNTYSINRFFFDFVDPNPQYLYGSVEESMNAHTSQIKSELEDFDQRFNYESAISSQGPLWRTNPRVTEMQLITWWCRLKRGLKGKRRKNSWRDMAVRIEMSK